MSRLRRPDRPRRGVGGPAPEPPPGPLRHPGTAPPRPTSQGDDALDLGATVLPVLVKSYWKQGAAGLAVIAFIIWLIRRD